jgi:calcineurin-like phosphoesterase family protein
VIWVTADLHLDHDNIIKYCNRPFSSTGEMAAVLLDNIRRNVAHKDTLYILGDFAWDKKAFERYAEEVKAWCPDTIWLKGNHDYKQKQLQHAAVVRHNKRKYYLSHYPLATIAPGYTNVHGHCHGNFGTHGNPSAMWRIDVGVDVVALPVRMLGEYPELYRPMTLDEVADLTQPFSRHAEYGEQ